MQLCVSMTRQVAQEQSLVRDWLLHPAPISAQDGLDPLQLAFALVVLILSSISTKTSLALAVGITCNLHW